jgi:hypothetical protein
MSDDESVHAAAVVLQVAELADAVGGSSSSTMERRNGEWGVCSWKF